MDITSIGALHIYFGLNILYDLWKSGENWCYLNTSLT